MSFIPFPLLDYAEGQRLKREGIEKATSYPFDEPVGRARLMAIALAKRDGSVCADSLRVYLNSNEETRKNVLENLSPASWGGIFSGCKRLKMIDYRNSEVKSRHSGTQGLWCLAD